MILIVIDAAPVLQSSLIVVVTLSNCTNHHAHCVNLKHIFSMNLFVFFMTTIILPKQSRGLLISHQVLSLYFSQIPIPAFHFSLKHCSLELWVWLYGMCGIIPNKPGNVRCRDNNQLISRSDYFSQNYEENVTRNAAISNSAGIVVTEHQLHMCWFMHYNPEPFDPHSTKRHSIRNDWNKNTLYTLHSKTTCSMYARTSLTNNIHSFFAVSFSLCNKNHTVKFPLQCLQLVILKFLDHREAMHKFHFN